ncbi:MAG: type VI secretion system ATPase TssH [Desulfovibrio sp.]|uniref:type VI secretion system ATPase TssH n=1 Tax=Desulfovibrio sp. 7SRBS1 TaxID=3378064 RepID=UPI003B3C0B83
MLTTDLRSLIAKLGPLCTTALHNGAGLAVTRTNHEVTIEHFLIKLLENPSSDLSQILRAFDVESSRIMALLTEAMEELRTGNAGKPVFSPLLLELFQDAWSVSSLTLNEPNIRSGAIMLAFLAKPRFFASGAFVDALAEVSKERLEKDFWTIVKGSAEQATKGAGGGSAGPAAAGGPGGEANFISRFCIDFTRRAKDGDIDPVFGRDQEIRQIVDILARRRKNNPILVGEPGVGKTAVIEGLALRITQDDVPEILQGVTLLGLDMGALEAGAGMKGEFENRLKGVLTEIKSSEKPIVLFIDEAHTLVGAGGTAGGSDAANLLKPALARGEIKTCAATTWTEYKKYFEKDPALARRFQLVKLDPPSVETTKTILRGLKASYEKAHRVIVRDDAIVAAAEMSDRYIAGRFLPDKAIDLLDTSCARVKVNLSSKPGALEDTQRSIAALQREKDALLRDQAHNAPVDVERLEEIDAKLAELDGWEKELAARWKEQKELADKVLELRAKVYTATTDEGDAGAPEAEAEGTEETTADADTTAPEETPKVAPKESPEESLEELRKQLLQADAALAAAQGEDALIHVEVNPDQVGKVVADWTGIPVGKLARDQARMVGELKERMNERIKGQDHALDAIAQELQAARSGLTDPSRPQGVFLLVGPSGVGKTESGLCLADLLFGDERSVVTVNMSEFQEKHTVSRLIGSPPGYVGYGEGGMLTEAVRQHPYSVVLMDEVEKAHPDVLNLFYQVFDKGMLSDGEGKEINFRNTIIMLTSNLASDVIQEMTTSGDKMPLDTLVAAIRPILSDHFKPALLARMTIVPYGSLAPEAMKMITGLKLGRLQKTLMDNNKMKLTWSDKVVESIAERCTEVETGARNIEYILNGNLLPLMSRRILSEMGGGEMPSKVAVDMDEDGGFTVEFSG